MNHTFIDSILTIHKQREGGRKCILTHYAGVMNLHRLCFKFFKKKKEIVSTAEMSLYILTRTQQYLAIFPQKPKHTRAHIHTGTAILFRVCRELGNICIDVLLSKDMFSLFAHAYQLTN